MRTAFSEFIVFPIGSNLLHAHYDQYPLQFFRHRHYQTSGEMLLLTSEIRFGLGQHVRKGAPGTAGRFITRFLSGDALANLLWAYWQS